MTYIIKNIIYYTLFIQFFTLLIKAQRYCNGYENLCYKTYDDVVYPTTHNSYAIAQQLMDGIRGLMLDIFPYDDGSVHLCHTKCNDPLYLDAGDVIDTLSLIASFLEQNPNEIITLFFENFSGNVPAYLVNDAFTRSGLINYVFTPTIPGQWPTLGEMIDTHQNVVVFTDKLFDPAYPWYLSLDQYVSYTNYVSLSNEYWNCDVKGGSGSLFLLYHMKHVQVLDYGYLPDSTIIDKTNSINGINEQTQFCERKVNYIAVDYYNHGDVIAFAAGLNGEDYKAVKKSKLVSGVQDITKYNKYINLVFLFILSFLFI